MIAHNIEYEEAPSGHVTFYNYKEPLMKFEGGFGFVGALVFDGYSDKIQCHFCGNWFDALGNHLAREHSMDVAYYKKQVGLNVSTALINEKTRQKLIANGMEKRKKNLVNRKGKKVSAETRARIAATLKENRDEQKNLRGTCPDQLIDRLQKMYLKLGHTPDTKSIAFYEALIKTYGSMKEACMVAGIPYRAPGETLTRKHSNLTEESVIRMFADFFKAQNRWPLKGDIGKKIYNSVGRFGGHHYIKSRALAIDGVFQNDQKIRRYTKDELLRFLTRFEEINGRKPSYSDCKRGLLPRLSRYSYNFGSWRGALLAAFPNYSPSEARIERQKLLPPAPVLSLRERYNLGKKRVAARKARLQENSALK